LGNEAFRWVSGGGMTGLGDFSGGFFGSYGLDVSADGSVVVGYGSSASGQEAFRWTSGGGMVKLGDLAGGDYGSLAQAVSSDGSIVVGDSQSATGAEAFRWTAGGGMSGLGVISGNSRSYAEAVSDDGSVIVGVCNGGSWPARPFIWTPGTGMVELKVYLESTVGLDLTGWALETAEAVSPDGTVIVGRGFGPSGEEGWIANIAPPEPVDLGIYTAVELVWPSVSGVTYQVQYSTNLVSTNWFNLDSSILGDGTTNSVFDSVRGTEERYYRIVQP